jgi:hypothetical protein
VLRCVYSFRALAQDQQREWQAFLDCLYREQLVEELPSALFVDRHHGGGGGDGGGGAEGGSGLAQAVAAAAAAVLPGWSGLAMVGQQARHKDSAAASYGVDCRRGSQ